MKKSDKNFNSNSIHKKLESKIFLLLIISIFICETSIMLLLHLLPKVAAWAEALIDSSVLSLLIFPVIYYYQVTPLKKSIADGHKKEADFKALIDNMGEGVGICDENEIFTFVNAAAEQIFETTPGGLKGKGLDHYLTKEELGKIVNQTHERIKGKTSVYESEIVFPDGKTKTILITATPQFDGQNFKGTLGIFRDITLLKKAEATITYERNLLRGLIDNLPDAVYVKDIHCRKVIANLVDVKYMGFENEEQVLGKNDFEVYDKATAESSYADDQYVFKTGLPQLNKEDYFIDNQHEEHWMLNSKVPIKNAEGEIIGLVGISRDISLRKKEETRLKLLESVITNATDAVIITKVDPSNLHSHKIIFVNAAFLKMTGYTEKEIIGRSPSLLQGPATDPHELRRVSKSLASFQPCEMEVINYKKTGEPFWSNISLAPITDNNGNYSHWISIKRDVTERKQMEQDLILAKEKAEAGSKAKSEFLANMSHEIRTPLNSVIGFSDLLMKTSLDNTQHQYISAVYQSANSLLDIISEILDFSKIEAGKLEIDIDKTDILELGYQVADMFSFQAYKKDLEILLNIGLDIPRFIWTDAVRIRQVLVNLLGNAVKFTEKGEIEFKIHTLIPETEGKTTIRFIVRDTGIGIEPANQYKIFDAFSQEDSSINRKFGGTGLGLAISKRLLELMGSELKLESIPLKGSTFYFDLHVKTMHGAPVEWSNAYNYRNMLIVDDNDNNRLILKDMLATKQITTDEAKNGLEALQKIKAGNKYDVVLMDYHMPEMDGLETIKNIRIDLNIKAKDLPIMLLHSSADDETINKVCKELDVNHQLVKPIKMKDLYETLSRIGYDNKYQSLLHQRNEGKKDKSDNKLDYFKILLVDDNSFNILLIKTIISDILPNAALLEAVDGKEALDISAKEQPDLIFMDIQMPVMNGYDATRQIRKLNTGKKVPIIALTAGTLKDEREKCLEAGMNDYVSKPFVIASIERIIDKWLQSKNVGEYTGNWEI